MHCGLLSSLVRLLVVLCGTVAGADAHEDFINIRYVVIGGGPAGLQMAHYLQSSGRTYVVLEKSDTVGAFFAKYPRFNQLSSMNKRFTGGSSLESSLRHDWNSLLSDPSHSGDKFTPSTGWRRAQGSSPKHLYPGRTNSSSSGMTINEVDKGLLLRHITSEFYPSASSLVAYLKAFAKAEKLNVQLNSTVIRVERYDPDLYPDEDVVDDARYVVVVQQPNHQVTRYVCRYVIVATGLSRVVDMPGNGLHLASTYESMSTKLEDYDDARVLVVGRDNTALEVAQNLQPHAATIHVVGPYIPLSLAVQSRYHGDIRHIYSGVLESYQLSSTDSLIETEMPDLTLVPDPVDNRRVYVLGENASDIVAKGFAPCAGCSLRASYDHVILCPGFQFNKEPFDKGGVRIPYASTVGNGAQYPAMTATYEAILAPGIYFAGALTHTRDFRKSSAGEIAGFRYKVRALHRILEELERAEAEGEAADSVMAASWPSIAVPHTRAFAAAVLKRINLSSGLYRMPGELVDVFLLSNNCSATHSIEALTAVAGIPVSQLRGADDIDALLDRSFLQGAQSFPAPELCGWYFEELPVASVPGFVHRWSYEVAGSVRGDAVDHLYAHFTVALEYGNVSNGDSFRLDRNTLPPIHPESSTQLHPVIRFYDSRIVVPHERSVLPESRAWWDATGFDAPDGREDEEISLNNKVSQKQDKNAQAAYLKYLHTMKELADEALDVVNWHRHSAFHLVPGQDESKLVDVTAMEKCVGPKPTGYLTPVTDLHLFEDVAHSYNLPDRHVSSLLRFLEHVSEQHTALFDNAHAGVQTAQEKKAHNSCANMQALASLVATMQDDQDTNAWVAAIQPLLPPYNLGYFGVHRLCDLLLASNTAKQLDDAHAVTPWSDSVIREATRQHQALQSVFQASAKNWQLSGLNKALLRIMSTAGEAVMYKTDWEMRHSWYETEHRDNIAAADVFKVASGNSWLSALPIPVRDSLFVKGPGSHVLSILVHAGLQSSSGAVSGAENLLKRYAQVYPELAFIEINLNKTMNPEGAQQSVHGTYDRGGYQNSPYGPLALLDYLRLDPDRIPCIVVLANRAAARDRIVQWNSPVKRESIEIFEVPLGGHTLSYLDGGLKKRLFLAQRQTNQTILGMPAFVATDAQTDTSTKVHGASATQIEANSEQSTFWGLDEAV